MKIKCVLISAYVSKHVVTDLDNVLEHSNMHVIMKIGFIAFDSTVITQFTSLSLKGIHVQ